MWCLRFVGACAAAVALLAIGARLAEARAALADPRLGAAGDAFLDTQAASLLAEVERTFERIRPSVPEPTERRLALGILDALFHDVFAPSRKPVQRYYHACIGRAVRDMETTRVERGARIWKLYNMGFVVRTPTATVAFDLQRGARSTYFQSADKGRTDIPTPDFPIDDALTARLVLQCDVLFISHRHDDHADPSVARAFVDQGKPVVGTEDVFRGTELQQRITHLERGGAVVHHLPIQRGARALDVGVYPGLQGSDVPNNVVIVTTPDGLCFAHDGDQAGAPSAKAIGWIDHVKDAHRVDVLMTNCWTDELPQIVSGFAPAAVVFGHENELSHAVDQREPYWRDSTRLPADLSRSLPEMRTLVMAWGETYHYAPTGTRRIPRAR